MFNIKKNSFSKRRKRNQDITPEEIFLDSRNLPKFNTSQFEGRIEKPITKRTVLNVSIFFILIALIFSGKILYLQIVRGEELYLRSADNNLRNIIQFPERGIIYDRNGVELAWNIPNSTNPDFPERKYFEATGFSHVLGFVDYPKKDKSNNYYEYKVSGQDGVEKYFDEKIGGSNGLQIIETDVFGNILSESTVDKPQNGEDITLSIDYRVQNKMYELLEETASLAEFQGGAGVIMDVETGEVLAMTSYPEYSSQVMTDKNDSRVISGYSASSKNPFINRVTSGLYTPGSIMKPFIALAALSEDIISPTKKILSTGSISIQNPYNPDLKTTFKDWKAHGWVDMRDALAVSSNVYFYTIGGGYEDQVGLGISRIEKYLRDFGFSQITNFDFEESSGIIPNPKWKKDVFDDDWRIGDTYITSIGQFGFQITPIQAVRSTAMIANNGRLLKPTIELSKFENIEKEINISKENFRIIQEGMRQAVTKGTASPLNFPYVKVAVKTGTAEIGVLKESVNSWIIGYFPYDNPRYAFAVVMERRHSNNPIGGLYVMTNLIDWMHINTPEYLK